MSNQQLIHFITSKKMRKINKIVVHCTATQQSVSIPSIKIYWYFNLKWKNYGYHYIIEANGNTVQLTDLENIANGASGYNKNSIHIAYIGGIDNNKKPIDNRTVEQKNALRILIMQLASKFPDADILGHYQLPNVKKACPCYDAAKEYRIYNKNYKASDSGR